MVSASKIDLDHLIVVLHRIHRALGQHAALVQDGDAGIEAADKRHVVLDHDDRVVPRDVVQ